MMRQRIALLINLLLVFIPLAAMGEVQEPEWVYPITADILENRNGFLTIASRDELLDSDFVPRNLQRVNVRSVVADPQLRKEAALALEAMFAAAQENGYTLYIKSAYRSYQTQNTMYHNRLEKYKKDDGVVAYPGSSDHQTGLGVDVLNYEWTRKEGMTPAFGETAEAKWMASVCAEYGFILRYLEGKEDITGIIYEPWHFRYVGEPVARYIMNNGLTLEEFTQEYRAAIADYEAASGDFAALARRLTALPEAVTLTQTDSEGDSEVSFGGGLQ